MTRLGPCDRHSFSQCPIWAAFRASRATGACPPLASLQALWSQWLSPQPSFYISSVFLETRAWKTEGRARGEKVLSPGGGRCLSQQPHKVRCRCTCEWRCAQGPGWERGWGESLPTVPSRNTPSVTRSEGRADSPQGLPRKPCTLLVITSGKSQVVFAPQRGL